MPERGIALRKMRRLAAMRPREIAHRAREKAWSQLERFGVRPRNSGLPRGSLRSWLADAPLRRFYPGIADSDRAWVRANFPEWIAAAEAEADRICRHEFQLLGFPPVTLEGDIDWHRDPCSGHRWELKFWTSYKPQDDAGGRDVKIIHELNRHQHLPRLAKAWLWTGNESYASEAVAQMLSWIDQNPPGMGINWQSSLELAIRSVSWQWTIFALLGCKAFDESAAEKICTSLFAQLQHVSRHLSTYTSPNTHLIGEAAALFIAGLVFGEHACAFDWLATGAAVLNQEARKQVLDGAVYGELSSWYHCYTIDFYLQTAILARQNRRDLAPDTERTLENMLEFLMHLTRPDGSIPLLGDDDGGRALALARRDYRSFSEALAIGAILFHRSDFKQQAARLYEEAYWLFGRRGLETYREIGTDTPHGKTLFFPTAGYALQRSGWHAGAAHLVFDCGGLGILAGGHAHADALSLNLFSGGKEMLVDPGTFVYNGQPHWRSYFRSTRAHNTVTVDGRDQTEMAGTFAWNSGLPSRGSFRAMRTVPHLGAAEPVEWMEGEHEGYASAGVSHRRSVLRAPGDYWIVLDRFSGSGKHRFDFHYHFGAETHPRLIRAEDGVTEVRAQACSFILGMGGSEPLESVLLCGETDSQNGWASRSYGEKHPIPTLRSVMSADLAQGSAGAITLLIPGAADARIRWLPLEAGRGIACSVERGGFTDTLVFSPGGTEVQAAGAILKGEFLWMRSQRRERGQLQSSLTIRAESFKYQFTGVPVGSGREEAICAQSAEF